jgi:hypothetical protein
MSFFTMQVSAAWLFLAFVNPSLAFFKVPCSTPLVIQRADPIVQPGIASGHVHTIMGGSGFGFTMDYNMTQSSRCNSCSAVEDKSNYWVASLYYHAENGSFTQVPQNGGALIYYEYAEMCQLYGSASYLTSLPDSAPTQPATVPSSHPPQASAWSQVALLTAATRTPSKPPRGPLRA